MDKLTIGSQKGKSGSTLELIDNEIENEFEIVPESVHGSTGAKTVPELAIGKTEEKKPEHSKSTTEDNTKVPAIVKAEEKIVSEPASGKTEEKKVPAELVISKTEEKIVPEPASGNNADKTVPKPASNVDKTVPEEPAKTVPAEPAKTVPEPAKTVPESAKTVPEPAKTVLEPAKTVQEPAIAKNEDETIVPLHKYESIPENGKSEDVPEPEISTKEKVMGYAINALKLVGILTCLYFFICSLDILSTSFKLLSGKATGEIFNADWLQNNPVVGLMIGVLGTVLVQSSSTFTSIIVAAIGGAGLKLRIAVPMLMGANIGTSVTNTLVAMTQIGSREEFERAFSAATVHDMFNWATVIVLFPLESLFGIHGLENMTGGLAASLVGGEEGGSDMKFMSVLTDPLVKSIIKIDKKVMDVWAEGPKGPEVNCTKYPDGNNYTTIIHKLDPKKNEIVSCDRILHQCLERSDQKECNYLFHFPEQLGDGGIGAILLVLSLICLCGSLMIMVKILNTLLQGSVAVGIKKVVNPKFDNPIWGIPANVIQYLFGYVNILIGAVGTILLQSSSIFTSTLTPMVGVGLVEVETVYPLFLGSNIGTTFTAMLAALAQPSKDTIQGALVHLFYNLIGILIFYPIPFLRFPIPLCKKLGKITATYRWFAIVYVVGMFFVMPGFFVLLTMIDSKGITMYTFMLIIFVLITGSMVINWMQSNTKPVNELLPEKLRNWEFLPEPLKSFEPYDRLLTGCSCCPTADDLEAQKVDEVELQEQKSGGIDNPSMDYKQF